MNDTDRLRVQMSGNLSLALIAAAFTTFGGVAAAFVVVADKISLTYGIWLALAVIIASAVLVLSIFFGGKGVRATNRVISLNPTPLPPSYDGGNFQKQAVCGLIGLGLGVLIFVAVGIGEIIARSSEGKTVKTSEIDTLRSDIQKVRGDITVLHGEIKDIATISKIEGLKSEVQKVTEEMRRFWDELNLLKGKQTNP